MSELDDAIASARAELAILKTQTPTEPAANPYAQTAYDIGTGALKAGWGLADLLTTPAVAVARAGGLDVPYFGISKMGAQDLAAIAPQYGLTEGSKLQELASFVTPLPSAKKAQLASTIAKEAGLGLSSYLGMKGAEQIAPESQYVGLIGALAAPAATTATAKTLSTLAPTLEKAGESLQRSALGFRPSDFTKVSKNQIIETLPGEYITQAQKSADNIIKNETLGKTTDPTVLYSNLQDAKENAETAIQSVLQKVDETRQTGIIPRLDETLQWINTKAPADKVGFYKNKVNSFLQALKEQGQGSLVYLNQQKKAIGENWKSSPETDPTFWRKFYKDIKTNIETYAPEVKELNKAKQDLIVVEPVIERGFRTATQGITPQDLRKALLYTTGGGGLVGATALTGGIVPGALLSGALALAGTKRGQKILGKTLSNVGGAIPTNLATPDSLSMILGKAVAANQTSDIGNLSSPEFINQNTANVQTNEDIDATIASLQKELEQLRNSETTNTSIKKQDISMLADDAAAKHGVAPSLVKAVIQAESSFKPDAVSKVGAQGLMQLMPKTAEALGVTDPFDPAQNIEGGVKYLAQLIKKFGSEDLALAAYNWGEGRIRNQLNRLERKGKPQTLAAILKYGTLPEETQNYLRKIKQVKTEIA
jgi:hypothetical protein